MFTIQHHLPKLDCEEEYCLADFKIRKATRLTYPGACSHEFQNQMHIIIEKLFQWDIKKQKAKRRGILGTVLGYAPADEEQGRKTLHRHWQIWVKELNQDVRDALFLKDDDKREKARSGFCRHIDAVMSASYGPDLTVTHTCEGTGEKVVKTDLVQNIFQDRDPQIFRNARHKNLCHEIKGKLMECKDCGKQVSSIDVVNLALTRWKQIALKSSKHERHDTVLPMSPERLDMAAYTYSYNLDGGCAIEEDIFWGNKKLRDILLRVRFDEHEWCHRASCFKKGCECRFIHPQLTCLQTHIHQDEGKNGEHVIEWHRLDGDSIEMAPWMVLPRRPMGCQSINTHNVALSEFLNCNTNIQIGDMSQVYYSTLYNSKSTQAEDSERQQRVGHTIIKRLLRIEEEILEGKRKPEDVQDGFVEGLCRMLGGMNAATSRNVISSTMAHLLVCNNGSRFQFSHDFGNLLVGQLEATLEGRPTDVRVRTNVLKGERIVWPDSSADDYIHRPNHEDIDQLCSYELTMLYKKKYKQFREMAGSVGVGDDSISGDEDEEGDAGDDCDNNMAQHYEKEKYAFVDTHPGHSFSHLAKLKLLVIPKVALPQMKLCNVEDLEIKSENPSDDTKENRENYAKMALLMFYPFRHLNDLKKKGSYWKKFHRELKIWKINRKRSKKSTKRKHTKFWERGFQILQNMQDTLTMEKKVKRARDPITMTTQCEQPDDPGTKTRQNDENDPVSDILQFCSTKR